MKSKSISLLVLSSGEERSNVPKHCHGISFREMAALTDALKELPTDSELESEVVFCPGFEPFVEFDLRKRQPKHVEKETNKGTCAEARHRHITGTVATGICETRRTMLG